MRPVFTSAASAAAVAFCLFSSKIEVGQAIDLCFLFGTCDNNNNNQGRQDNGGETPIYVEGKWLESPTLNNDQLYLFANDVGTKNWYDAERYCEEQGGFLAETYTQQESEFLSNHAASLPQANWWIGFRETEVCECVSVGRSVGSPATFPALFDHTKTFDQADSGLVRTKCPPEFEKRCVSGEREWRWSLTGRKDGYTHWNIPANGQIGEPNGRTEHCTAMWFKAVDFRWADWACFQDADSGKSFHPLCQRDKNEKIIDGDDDYDDDDYDDDDDKGKEDKNEDLTLPDGDCIMTDALVRKPEGTRPLAKIKNVASHLECQQKCVDNLECSNWSWKGFKNRPKCILFADISPLQFKRKTGGVAGTVLKGCTSRGEDASNNKETEETADFCVEYRALYGAGPEVKIRTVKSRQIEGPEDCRKMCLQEDGCVRYSWKGRKDKRRGGGGGRKQRRNKKQKCSLFREGAYSTIRRKTGVSGNVLDNCAELALTELDSCQCTSLTDERGQSPDGEGQSLTRSTLEFQAEFFDAEDNVNDEEDGDVSLVDILSGDLTDIARITCPGRNKIKRCSASSIDKNEPLTSPEKGEYCVDHHIFYEEGDEIRHFENVQSADLCRSYCESTLACQYYTWFLDFCSLKSSGNWEPVYEEGAVSGSTRGGCRNVDYSQLALCECQEFEYDDDYGSYDEDDGEDVDLVGLGIIGVRMNDGDDAGGDSPDGCPAGQGKRCYLAAAASAGNDDSASNGRIGGGGGGPLVRLNFPTPATDSSAVRFGRILS